MYPFTILAVSDLAFEAGLEIVMNSFAEFYHDLTPKHQKQIKLIFIDKGGYTIPVMHWSEKLNIKPIVQVINWKRMEKVEDAFHQANFLFLQWHHASFIKRITGVKLSRSRKRGYN